MTSSRLKKATENKVAGRTALFFFADVVYWSLDAISGNPDPE